MGLWVKTPQARLARAPRLDAFRPSQYDSACDSLRALDGHHLWFRAVPAAANSSATEHPGLNSQDSALTVSSRTTSPSDQRASRQQESPDSYPNIPEPRQSHAGNALAILSVFAILAFGAWTALGTYTGSLDKPAAKPQTTATAAATQAPAAASAPTGTATPSATSSSATPPGATPGRAATTTTGGRVHVVGSGDTLYKIAQLYGTTVEAVMAANGFKDRSQILHVGDKLTIP